MCRAYPSPVMFERGGSLLSGCGDRVVSNDAVEISFHRGVRPCFEGDPSGFRRITGRRQPPVLKTCTLDLSQIAGVSVGAVKRCRWAEGNDLAVAYHDEEWGVPSRDDRYLFEMLILEGAQAGLSWNTILAKRAEYQRVYQNFAPPKVARFDKRKRERLLANPGIVRNRLKVESSVTNAKAFLAVQADHGAFANFLWGFAGNEVVHNRRAAARGLPTETDGSRELSRTLKRLGFRFVGPTICYAFMQAVGLVNDHEVGCFRYQEVKRLTRSKHSAS